MWYRFSSCLSCCSCERGALSYPQTSQETVRGKMNGFTRKPFRRAGRIPHAGVVSHLKHSKCLAVLHPRGRVGYAEAKPGVETALGIGLHYQLSLPSTASKTERLPGTSNSAPTEPCGQMEAELGLSLQPRALVSVWTYLPNVNWTPTQL